MSLLSKEVRLCALCRLCTHDLHCAKYVDVSAMQPDNMRVQVPLRQDGRTDVTFDTGDPLDWQGDGLLIGLHQEAVAGDAIASLRMELGH